MKMSPFLENNKKQIDRDFLTRMSHNKKLNHIETANLPSTKSTH